MGRTEVTPNSIEDGKALQDSFRTSPPGKPCSDISVSVLRRKLDVGCMQLKMILYGYLAGMGIAILAEGFYLCC